MIQGIRRALVGTGSTAATLIGACLIGFGVPLFWIWLASALFSSIGLAPSPASWISVGTTHPTASWARFHWHASCIGVSRAASAIGRIRSSRSRPRSIHPAGRNERWSARSSSVPGIRSSQKMPP